MIRTVILDFDGACPAWNAQSLAPLRAAGGEDMEFRFVTIPEPVFAIDQDPGQACLRCNDEVADFLRSPALGPIDQKGAVIASGVDLRNMFALFSWYNGLPYPRPRLIVHYTRMPWHFAPRQRDALMLTMKDPFESWPMAFAVTARFSAESESLAAEIKAIENFHPDTKVTPWPLTSLDLASAQSFLRWLVPPHLRFGESGAVPSAPDGIRVLLFAPFGEWHAHHQLEAVMGRMLINGGHIAHIINCDGLFVGCPSARGERNCLRCQYHHRRLFAQFDLPESVISDWLEPDEIAAVHQWADGLDAGSLHAARYGEIPAGELAASTLLTQFNITTRDDVSAFDEVQRTHRLYLAGAVLSYRAVDRAVAALGITHLLLFNGRIYPYKAALAVARAQGLDVVVHERGRTEGSFEFFDNISCTETLARIDQVVDWADVPLAGKELAEISTILDDRLADKGRNWPSFYSAFKTLEANFFDLLDIPRNAKIIAYFTTSPAELCLEPGYENVEAQFDSIDLLADICAETGYYLVVRHHPAIGGTLHSPCEKTGLTLSYQQQKRSDRPNLRVILPNDPIMSNALMPHLDGAIALYSSVGIELAAAGVPTITSPVSPLSLTRADDDPLILHTYEEEEIRRVVGNLLALSDGQYREYIRRCLRSIYVYYGRLPSLFTAIGIRDVFFPVFNFTSNDDIVPGLDKRLDDLYSRLTKGTPILPVVGEAERSRSIAEEDAQLTERLASVRARFAAREAQRAEARPAGQDLPELLLTDLGDGPSPVDHIYGRNHRWLKVGEGPLEDRLARLGALLRESSAEWVWLGSPHYHLSGIFATRIGQTLRDIPDEVIVLPLTGWFAVQGSIQLERYSGAAMTKELLSSLSAEAPGLQDVWSPFGLAVWRKSCLQDLIIPAFLGAGDRADYPKTLIAALQGQAPEIEETLFYNY